MKITSNLKFNTSLLARHVAQDETVKKVVIGSSAPEYLNIPAGATIELPDKEWAKFATAAKPMLAKGSLTLTQAPKLSTEDQAASDEARLNELRAEAEAIMGRQETKKAPATAPEKAAK